MSCKESLFEDGGNDDETPFPKFLLSWPVFGERAPSVVNFAGLGWIQVGGGICGIENP